MPRYVYQNLETGEQYEFEQRFQDPGRSHQAPDIRPGSGVQGFRLVRYRFQVAKQVQPFREVRC